MSKLRFFEESGKRLFVSKDHDAGNLWAGYTGPVFLGDGMTIADDDLRTVVASYGPKARGDWNEWADVLGDVLVIVTNKVTQ